MLQINNLKEKVLFNNDINYKKKYIDLNSENMSLIKVEIINELISTCLWSGYIKDRKPISMLLVTKPEYGKTEILKQYRYNKGIVYMNDITAWGIAKEVFPRIIKGENVHHIIIPDLLNPIQKQQATSKQFLQFISSLIEEGILNVKTYGIDMPEIIKSLNKEVQCGLITAITKEKFQQKRRIWGGDGVLSRFVPISYSYSISTLQEIFNSIFDGNFNHNEINIDFPEEKIIVEENREINQNLNHYSTRIANQIGLDGIRLQKAIQILLQAHALMNGRNKVEKVDEEFMIKSFNYINYNFNII